MDEEFSLPRFEQLIDQKSYDRAGSILARLLLQLADEHQLHGLVGREAMISGTTVPVARFHPFDPALTFRERLDLYQRLADAITRLYSDPDFEPAGNVLAPTLLYKNYLREIFACSSYPNMDHILLNLGLLDPNKGLKLTPNRRDFIKFLMCYTLDTSVNVNFRLFFRFDMEVAAWAYIGMLLGSHRTITRRAEEVRNYLLSIHEVMRDIPLTDEMVQVIVIPWMLCTYADFERKHDLKDSVNHALENWLDRKLSVGIRKRAARNIEAVGNTKNGKPVMAVCSEKLTTGHAVHRCFAKSFEAIREQYYTVLVSDPAEYDANTAQLFDEVCELDSSRVQDIEDIAKAVLKLEPQIIYYPSIGMAAWTMALGNMRLAKRQVMTGAHPASSRSRHIDYFIALYEGRGERLSQDGFTEKLLLIHSPEAETYLPHDDTPDPMPDQAVDDGVVRIAINSALMKITPKFLEVCQVLTQQSTVPIEYHFFIAEKGIRLEGMRRTIVELLPNSRIYPPTPFAEYMANLSQCHLSLGTFPFGGTNTNVDLAMLGIPKINMLDQADISGQLDLIYWNRFEIDEMLFAKDEFNYLANCIYLIHDTSFRADQSTKLLSSENREIVLAPRGSDYMQYDHNNLIFSNYNQLFNCINIMKVKLHE